MTHVPTDCPHKTKPGSHVQVHYKGSLEDGTVFDASYGRLPIGFEIGAGRVIAGWEQGLLDMCVGEKRTLTIPPELGYGSSGIGPIPPNAVLSTYNFFSITPQVVTIPILTPAFDVELVDVYIPKEEL